MDIGILGAGTWGTAIARLLAGAGHRITLWSAVGSEIDALAATRTHPKLPGVSLPEDVELTKLLGKAVLGSDAVVFAVPSVFVRSVAREAAPLIAPDQLAVSLAKGIEPVTFMTMTEIISDELPHGNPTVALSGPTHAEEVGRDLPTAIVAASGCASAALKVQRAFSTPTFRVYTNSDPHGVELCGALKNVMAIAAGVSDGIGYGDNAKAALITRGMAEIARLGKAMGCDERTFYGLAGVGDLIVTATSRHSRNNRAGYLMGSGLSAEDAVREVGMVVEGINALPAAMGLAERYGVEMPITFAVNDLVTHGGDPRETVNRLMNREYKKEA